MGTRNVTKKMGLRMRRKKAWSSINFPQNGARRYHHYFQGAMVTGSSQPGQNLWYFLPYRNYI